MSIFIARWFNPVNSDVVIVGDIGQAEAEAALTGTLGRWSNAGSQAIAVSVPAHVAAPGLYLIDRPGMEQVDLTVATLLDVPASPASAANAVMTSISATQSQVASIWICASRNNGRSGPSAMSRAVVPDRCC